MEGIFRDLKSGYSSVHLKSDCSPLSIPFYLTPGPLTYDDDGKQTLVGVVSWGKKPCALKGYPSVYARITEVLPWIEEELSKTC